MNTEKLIEWVDSNEVKEKTFEAFWENFNNYRNEEPEEFLSLFGDYNRDNLDLYYNATALKIVDLSYLDPSNKPLEVVESRIRVEYLKEHIYDYYLQFNLLGEVIDDYSVPTWKRFRPFHRIDLFDEIRNEIQEDFNKKKITIKCYKVLLSIIKKKQSETRDMFYKD